MKSEQAEGFHRVNALAALAVVLRSWRLFAGLAVLGGVIAGTYGLLVPDVRERVRRLLFVGRG